MRPVRRDRCAPRRRGLRPRGLVDRRCADSKSRQPDSPQARSTMTRSAPLEIREVRNGRGLVAARALARGQLICILHGRVRSARSVLAMWKRSPRRAANCIRCGAESYLDPEGEWGEFANHSCIPNAAVCVRRGGLQLRAITAIRIGQEVTHDYSTCLGTDDCWTMRCNCGARACRGVVRSVDRLPARALRRYLALGAIPLFILRTHQFLRG